MRHTRIVLVAFFLAVVSVSASTALHDEAEFTAAKQSEPPHAARPTAAYGTSEYLTPEQIQLRDEIDFAIWLVREREREEIERLERAQKDAASRVVPSRSGTSTPSTECGNTVLPEHIVQRESRGQCDAYNATGCGGRGCVGFAQLDVGHFAAVSPWNPSVPGTCFELSYSECVEKLWAGGSGASHWR